MKEYEFVVDAGVMTYFVKAESEEEARQILADDGIEFFPSVGRDCRKGCHNGIFER